MAKKKTAVKNPGIKKTVGGKNKRLRIQSALPQDSTAYVLLGDYTSSGGGTRGDPLVIKFTATAEDCEGNSYALSNFEFIIQVDPGFGFPLIDVKGKVRNPAQSSSEVEFELPFWADGDLGLTVRELVVTVSTKKTVRKA
jgi:hypothetical protein